jgi:uncharacterized peroxidase-related enzyme
MRLKQIDPAAATGKVKTLFDGLQAKLGIVPNLTRGLANSPAALEAYVAMKTALGGGSLDARFGERIALATAEANDCDYCLSAHTFIGGKLGLGEGEIAAARRGDSSDARIAEGLRFAKLLAERRGRVETADVERVRAAGYTDGEIAELVAHVAVNVFTNYFNLVNVTPIEFPHVKPLPKAARAA